MKERGVKAPWVYQTLFKHFGPQGWWPVSQKKKSDLKPSYHPGRYIKLNQNQAFEIAIGAILTQNTSWSNVEKAIVELKRKNLMSPKKISQAKSKLLANAIRPSGYFAQKTKKIKIFSQFVVKKAQSNLLCLKKEPLKPLRERLLSLWGIGPETADSILLYALEKPIFVIDAYTKRIMERLGWLVPGNYDEMRMMFESCLPQSHILYQEFHALLVKLAKKNCIKHNPLCHHCPLKSRCTYPLQASTLS